MTSWNAIADLAREWSSSLRKGDAAPIPGMDLVRTAAKAAGVTIHAAPEGDANLDGGSGAYDPVYRAIFYSAVVKPEMVPFVVAHELAHLWLGHGPRVCADADVDGSSFEASLPLGVERVEGYSPEELRERQANAFARELLLPRPLLRTWFLQQGQRAKAIAESTQAPLAIVYHQLSRALLTPEARQRVEAPPPPIHPEQSQAAEVEAGPFLLEAGPGTGKTRTLVRRLEWLLGRGVPPAKILVLTFSNKAAGELRSRIASVDAARASEMWIGTFHAFGLELLRTHGSAIGLPVQPKILDPLDAALLLEDHLAELKLDLYFDLDQPSRPFPSVLRAISRAKDEVVDSDSYQRLVDAMQQAAVTAEEKKKALQALEVGRIYRWYEAHLAAAGTLDFGDLISKSVMLLRNHPAVHAAVRGRFEHVLVDEYQDVNRASALLLKEVAGDGKGLWVVGDPRQSIYRFRGAAPTNITDFVSDYPGARRSALGRNFRAQPAVVACFSAYATGMEGFGPGGYPMDVDRTAAGGDVVRAQCEAEYSEAAGLAARIEALRAQNVPYGDQAVLCRSHLNLARVAGDLEARKIPVLYLGDLFERDEIRDLLSLVALAGGNGASLVRVARWPEYGVPLRDVLELLKAAREDRARFPAALQLAEKTEALSPAGKAGLLRLAEHLANVEYATTAWSMLVEFLFDRSSRLRELLGQEGPGAQQRGLAIFQFLQFAYEHRRPGRKAQQDPKRALLDLVRRLEMLGEERQLRSLPEWADSIDAVRILTMHASKGLEFSAVHLPRLIYRLPTAPDRCPTPPGLVDRDTEGDRLVEEMCLFFVAMSRARDHLTLSNAKRYGKQSNNPSRFLARIPEQLLLRLNWPEAVGPASVPPESDVADARASEPLKISTLEQYANCPRRYFYDHVLGLDAWSPTVPKAIVLGLIRHSLRSLPAGLSVDEQMTMASENLTKAWREKAFAREPQAEVYLDTALRMLKNAFRDVVPGEAHHGVELGVETRRGRLLVLADRVTLTPDNSVVVERFRANHLSAREGQKEIYGILAKAGAAAHPDRRVRLQTVFLPSGERRNIDPQEKAMSKAREKYEEDATGIIGRRFEPNPDDWFCPGCAYYFICPAPVDEA